MKTSKFLKFIEDQSKKKYPSIIDEGSPLDYKFDNIGDEGYKKALESSIKLANPVTAGLPNRGVLGVMKAIIGGASAMSGTLAGYSKLFPKESKNTTEYYDYVPNPNEMWAATGGFFSTSDITPPDYIKPKTPERPKVNTIPKPLDLNKFEYSFDDNDEEDTSKKPTIIPKDLDLAMHSVMGLGMIDDVLSYNEYNNKYDGMIKRMGNTDYINPSNYQNTYGDYTPNKGLGSNFQLSSNPIVRKAKKGGKVYETGGVYDISNEELEELKRQGVDFDILD